MMAFQKAFFSKEKTSMKKSGLIAILLILLTFNVRAQELQFSDSAVISVLTCSPGSEVYAKFGHTGVRVMDPVTGRDVVFNYGIFSFNTDNFYYKFIKGETDYFLGVIPTALFLPEYEERNSDVWEQKLNLTVAEKRNIINSLLENYKPENRVYRYNFVFDNCATRPRDKVLYGIDGQVKFDVNSESKTFREWVGVYVGESSWLKFGVDMVFGMDADVKATQFESMFLPEMLMYGFQMGKITDKEGVERNLVSETTHVVKAAPRVDQNSSFFGTPLFFFMVLLMVGIAISLYEIRRKTYFTAFDSILLLASGLAGIIVFYLMFFSIHPLVKSNLNLLWLNPFNFIAAFIIWIKPWRVGLFVYQLINIFLILIALVAMTLSLQVFNDAAFPLIVLLFVRYCTWFVVTKHKLYKKTKHFIQSIINK
jgi:hypothetical protein